MCDWQEAYIAGNFFGTLLKQKKVAKSQRSEAEVLGGKFSHSSVSCGSSS